MLKLAAVMVWMHGPARLVGSNMMAVGMRRATSELEFGNLLQRATHRRKRLSPSVQCHSPFLFSFSTREVGDGTYCTHPRGRRRRRRRHRQETYYCVQSRARTNRRPPATESSAPEPAKALTQSGSRDVPLRLSYYCFTTTTQFFLLRTVLPGCTDANVEGPQL